MTLAQVAAAVRKLAELKQTDLTGTRDDWAEAVKQEISTAAGDKEVNATA